LWRKKKKRCYPRRGKAKGDKNAQARGTSGGHKIDLAPLRGKPWETKKELKGEG